jgi:hypothetical protein
MVGNETLKHLVSPQDIELPFPDGGIAGRFDPQRGILEVQRRGVKHYFDLAQLVQLIQNKASNCKQDSIS